MPSATVNLDALISRSDLVSSQVSPVWLPRLSLSLSDLDKDGFFRNSLRKPDFQRETANWTPQKIVDLVKSFLDQHLIPAVILWNRGDVVFVIDGAHRLSALIAWIRDDYGDGRDSQLYLGNCLTEDQRRAAERTRREIKKEIGTYVDFKNSIGQTIDDEIKSRRLSSMGASSITVQWVMDSRAEAAEQSYFKINQAAQHIDPVEHHILQTRYTPAAIAARCIARGGKGHKYWSSFSRELRKQVEELGAEIFHMLYEPPHKQPVTTTDVPVGGAGYNKLRFAFNMVRLTDGQTILSNRKPEAYSNVAFPDDRGVAATELLRNVRKHLRLITTKSAESLGLHPLVYFYAINGRFQEVSFLAALQFTQQLKQKNKLNEFTRVRANFEEYLFKNRKYVSSTISKWGGGNRSLQRIVLLYEFVFRLLVQGMDVGDISDSLLLQDVFKYLKANGASTLIMNGNGKGGAASQQARSEAFINEFMDNTMKCAICNGVMHANSVSFDHKQRRREGGDGSSGNLRPTHPYCNTGYRS